MEPFPELFSGKARLRCQGCYARFRRVWAPKRAIPVGSLYDIVEEVDRQQWRSKEFKRPQLPGTMKLGNDVYESFETVMDLFGKFKLAVWDALRQLDLNQAQMYKIMSLWFGRSENNYKCLQLPESLRLSANLLNSLKLDYPERNQEVLVTYFIPVYKDIQQMCSKMMKLSLLMKQHVDSITPIMQNWTRRISTSSLEKRLKKKEKLCGRTLSKKAETSSESIYDPAYGTIVTEKSTSVVAWTLSTEDAAKADSSCFWSKVFRMFVCSMDYPQIIRAPPIVSQQIDLPVMTVAETGSHESVDSSLTYEIKPSELCIEPVQAENSPSQHTVGAIKRDSPTVKDVSEQEAKWETPFPMHTTPISAIDANNFLAPDSNVNTRKTQLPDQDANFSILDAFIFSEDQRFDGYAKGFTALTLEDINLENTEKHQIQTGRSSTEVDEESNWAIPEQVNANVPKILSTCNDCNDVFLSVVNPMKDLNVRLSTISGMIEEVEKRYFAVPVHFLNFERNGVVTFDEVLNTVLENIAKLEVIPFPHIYAEEEAGLIGGVKQIYLASLKCSELFNSLTAMLLSVREPLFDLLTSNFQSFAKTTTEMKLMTVNN